MNLRHVPAARIGLDRGGTRPAGKREASRGSGPVLARHAPGLGNQGLGLLLQRKLSVSHPQDAYEQEADRVADEVMRMPGSAAAVQRTARQIQRVCAECEGELRRQAVEQEEEVQREPAGEERPASRSGSEVDESTPEVGVETERRIDALKGAGRPLPDGLRAYMEPRFGYDFGAVRVHTDATAVQTARELSARAFTVGREIVFGAGEYSPQTAAGQRLIAHELVHVVQQDGAERDAVVNRTSRSGEGPLEEVQTRARSPVLGIQARPEDDVLSRVPSSSAAKGLIQRDFALEPPHPEAAGRALTEEQMRDAIDFNNRVVGAAGADVIGALRDVLGTSREPALIDADFVNAVVSWQAVQGLTQDGKLGPRSAAPLFREIGAEGVGRGEVKTGPTYAPSGTVAPTVAGGRESAHFRLRAEFESDPSRGIFPSCCEVRQFIRWDAAAAASFGATAVPHAGFPAGTAAGTWIEDRDAANNRYGHRSGPFADPQSFDQYLDSTGARNQAFGHIYRGSDTPGGPAAAMAGVWRFMIQVVDVCNGGKQIGGRDFVRVPW